MSGNRSHRLLIAIRREAVARLRARGCSVRQISILLSQLPEPIVAVTGEPISKSTVDRDIQFIEKEWREKATHQVDRYKAKQLASLEEVQRQAWSKSKLRDVMGAHDRIAKLLGLNAPVMSELSGPAGGPVQVEETNQESGAHALKILQALGEVSKDIKPEDKLNP